MIKFKNWVRKRKKRQKMFLSTHYRASSKGLMWTARLPRKKLWQVTKVKNQHLIKTVQESRHPKRLPWRFQNWLHLKKHHLLKVQNACIMWDKSAFERIFVRLKTKNAFSMSKMRKLAQRESKWICQSTMKASSYNRVRLHHQAQSTCASRILKRHPIVWLRIVWATIVSLNRIYSRKGSWYDYKTRSVWPLTRPRSRMLRPAGARQTRRSRQVNFDGARGSAAINMIALSAQKELTYRTGLGLLHRAWVTSAEWWVRVWAWVEWQWTNTLQA